MKIPLPKSYFKFLIVALLFVGQFAVGQTIIAADGFNNSTTLFSSSGTGAYFSGNSVTADRPASSPFAIEGTHSFGVTNGTATLTSSSNINTAGYSNIAMTLRLASFSIGSTGNGADTNDVVSVEVSPDGGANYYKTIEISGDGNSYWSYSGGTAVGSTPYDGNLTAVAFTGTNTAGISTVRITNLPAVSNLRFKIVLLNNATAERWVIDDFKVTGTLAGPTLTASPTTLTEMTYVAGSGPSNIKNFVLTGANLNGTQNVTVLPGDNWEVSTNQTTWFTYTTPLVLTNYNGASTTVSVRLKSGLPVATYNNASNDIIVLQGYGITPSSSVTLSGTVTAPIGKPVVANQTINGNFGTAINYQVVATNSPTSYTITGILPAGLSLNPTSGIISGTPTTVATSTVTVTATNGSGTSTPAATLTFNIAKGNQIITFAQPAAKQYGDADFTLAATASSGLTVTYTSANTSIAEIVGANTVKINGYGTTNITASQSGNANYNAASDLIQPFTVNKRDVTITGLTANNKTQDGSTTATLIGTAVLDGVLPADAADVELEGTPTATFATALPDTSIAVTVTGYTLAGTKASNYSLIQPAGLSADITTLGTPVATAATSIGSTSFVANWDAVTDASNYRLDVYTGTDAPGTTITETFTDIDQAAPGSYNTRTWTGDGGIAWSSYKSRTDQEITSGDLAVTLRDQADSYLESGIITGGLSNISFDVQQFFNGTGGVLTIKVLTGPTFSTSTTIGTKSFNATVSTYNSGIISGITGDYKIRIENNAAARPAIDNLSFTSAATSTMNFVAGYENLSVGNVTSHLVSGLTASTEYKYRVRVVLGTVTSPNSNVIDVTTTVTGTDVIWDGTQWSNTEGPTASLNAFIDGPYTTFTNGIFTAKSLTIRDAGSLNVSSGATITVIDGLNNTLTAADVVLQNNANLIQGGTTNGNNGDITVKRNSSLLKRQDYTLWSSPTSGTQSLLDFSPATLPLRFYTYNSNNNLYEVATPSGTFATAKSYLIRMPNTHPATATIWEGSFIGKPNSGNISYTLDNTATGFNAVGNPYPSAIDAFAFVDNTTNAASITGTLYFWRKTNNAASPSYSTWTTAGFVSNGEAQNVNPNGVIQIGQGFIVDGTGNGTTLEFSNEMRVNNHANQFFKSNNIVENNRIWLNATNADGLFSQTLVGYVTDASDDLDRADGKYMNDGPIALTTIINDTPYAIQARSLPFQATDVVAMQFKATDAGTYTIAIDHVDGLFDADQAIYLRDALTGTQHDLKSGDYTFASEAGTFADRFNLAYTNLLTTNASVLDANAIVIFKNDNQSFEINSGNILMASVKVFDIRGRLLTSQNNVNATHTTVTAGQSNEVLLVQVISVDGITVTKKVVR